MNEKDLFVWSLTMSRNFSVKSMYLDLLDDGTKVWKMKVPLKIKVFMWFLHRKFILTKDNLTKWIGHGMKHIVFVITWNPYNIFSLSAPLLRSYGASYIWLSIWHLLRMLQIYLGIWLEGIPKKDLVHIRVGVCAVIWTLWNTINDLIFNIFYVVPMVIH
jgi:hypothetical protein